MNPAQLKENFIEQTVKAYPALTKQQVTPYISDQLLSPFVVELPENVLQQAQAFVTSIFELRKSQDYIQSFSQELGQRGLQAPGNYSILMSYDFHLDPTGKLKLIEINTNAAFLALGDLMYRAHGIPQPVKDFSIQEVSKNILQELRLNGQTQNKNPKIAIIDDRPEVQKMFLEFLVFAEVFKANGWSTEICDYRELPKAVDFIYNRYTDFFLHDSSSQNLRDLFNSRKITLSPNPVEYLLLADKTRMMEWSQKNLPSEIAEHLPKAQILNTQNAEELWLQRKHLFFKPRRSFGAKQTYRGEKLSKKLYEEISSQDFIAQEYVAAPLLSFATEAGPQEFKYDLRFYAYQDRVQSVVARIYQGQVTNLKTPMGGFAPLKFS